MHVNKMSTTYSGNFTFILFFTCYVSAIAGNSDWHLCLDKCYYMSSKMNITFADQDSYCHSMGRGSKPVDFGSKLEQSLATELATCRLVKEDNEPYWINKKSISNNIGTPSCRTITFSGSNIHLEQDVPCSSMSHPFCETEKSFCQSSGNNNTITYDWVNVAGKHSYYKLSYDTYPYCEAKNYCEGTVHGKVAPAGNYSFMGLLAIQLGIKEQRKLNFWLDSPDISCPPGQGVGNIMRYAGPFVHMNENKNAGEDFRVLCESNTTTTPMQSTSTIQTTIMQKSPSTRPTTLKTSIMSTTSASTNMTTHHPVTPLNSQINAIPPKTQQPTRTPKSQTHLTSPNSPNPATPTMSQTNMTSSNTPNPATPTMSQTNMTSPKTQKLTTPTTPQRNMTSLKTSNPATPTMSQTNMTSPNTPKPTTPTTSQTNMTSSNISNPTTPAMSQTHRTSPKTQKLTKPITPQRNMTSPNTDKPTTPTTSQSNKTKQDTLKQTTSSQTNMSSSATQSQIEVSTAQEVISTHSSTADPSTGQSLTNSTTSSFKTTTGPGWIRIGQEEYFVNYDQMSYTKAERFCHEAMNASLVMFLNPITYFTILTEIPLKKNYFWVGAHGLDKEMLTDECLSYIVSSVTMTTSPCHYEQFSVCSRRVGGDVSRFLEDPEFKKLIREMTVLKNATGKRIRKQTCATDRRPSARAAGGVGVFIICSVIAILLMSDCSSVKSTFFTRKNKT